MRIPTTARHILTTAFAATAILLFPAIPAAAQPQTTATWAFEASMGDVSSPPTVTGRSDGAPERLRMVITREIPGKPRETLTSTTLEPANSVSQPLPRADKDAYVDLKLHRDDGSTLPLLHYRALVRPEGMDPMKYEGLPGFEPPDDFDAFWNRAKAELAAVPMNPVVTRAPDKDTTTGMCFRVDLPTVEETTVVAWYVVPKRAFAKDGGAARRYPAIFSAPGYGGAMKPVDRTAEGYITMNLNPRNHGDSREYWISPIDHLQYRLDEPERCYYKLAFLDCLRGVEFLMARPEVDPGRVGVVGGSQGGLFAVAVAALEPRVACSVSHVTSWAAFADREYLALSGTQMRVNKKLAEAKGTPREAQIRRTLALTDAASLATRVRCPLQVNMGGMDTICPWATGVVVVNRLPEGVRSEFNYFPDTKHNGGPAQPAQMRWLQYFLQPQPEGGSAE